MDRPGTRKAGVVCLALTLMLGGLGVFFVSLLCHDSLLLGLLVPSSGQLRYGGIISVLIGAILLAVVLLLTYLEAGGRGSNKDSVV